MIMPSKCLIVYPNKSTFVVNDIIYLRQKYNVDEYRIDLSKSILSNILFILRFVLFLIGRIKLYQLIYIWFADYYTPFLFFISRFYHVPVVLVIGGYEIEYIPSLGYGGFKNPIRKWAVKYGLKHSNTILAVSEYSYNKIRLILNHSNVHVVYNGIKTNMLPSQRELIKQKKDLFITVAQVSKDQTFYLKGLHRVIRLAFNRPDDQFVIIGIADNYENKWLRSLPPNIKKLPFLSHDQLIEYYKRAKFYFQLSEVESFGMAVLESIGYGTIPVVSNRGAMPELFKEIAIVVDLAEYDENPKILLNVLDQKTYDWKAREKIISRLSIEKRYQQLDQLLCQFNIGPEMK